MTKAHQLGEFGMIKQIARWAGSHPNALVAIGDDAAVLKLEQGHHLVCSTDSLIADVHFRLRQDHAYDIGRKALAVNLSDLAAMGAKPAFVLVSLAVSPDIPWEFVQQLYRGLGDEAQACGAAIVGGDTVSTPGDFSVHVTVLGEALPDAIALRRGAAVGDLIAVTHDLGASAAGLTVLEQPDLPVPEAVKATVIRRHLRPQARLQAGAELARGIATAMIDLSDGLAGDVHHLCRASGVGAVIYAESLPISEETRAVAAALEGDPLDFALRGGEDYELLFTTSRREWSSQVFLPQSGTPITVVGEIVPEHAGVRLEYDSGERVPLTGGGFSHF